MGGYPKIGQTRAELQASEIDIPRSCQGRVGKGKGKGPKENAIGRMGAALYEKVTSKIYMLSGLPQVP